MIYNVASLIQNSLTTKDSIFNPGWRNYDFSYFELNKQIVTRTYENVRYIQTLNFVIDEYQNI